MRTLRLVVFAALAAALAPNDAAARGSAGIVAKETELARARGEAYRAVRAAKGKSAGEKRQIREGILGKAMSELRKAQGNGRERALAKHGARKSGGKKGSTPDASRAARAGKPTPTKTPAIHQSRGIARDAVVIDGSQIPKELEFKGPASR